MCEWNEAEFDYTLVSEETLKAWGRSEFVIEDELKAILEERTEDLGISREILEYRE